MNSHNVKTLLCAGVFSCLGSRSSRAVLLLARAIVTLGSTPAGAQSFCGPVPVVNFNSSNGADPGAGDAEAMAGTSFVGQHEDVTKQWAHRAGLEIASIGRARLATYTVPIREKLARRRMLHTRTRPVIGSCLFPPDCGREIPVADICTGTSCRSALACYRGRSSIPSRLRRGCPRC